MHMALDYETHFDTKAKYSLKHMTTEAYLRDPRFEAHGAAVAFEREDPVWVPARDLPKLFRTLDWDKIVLTCHHAQFDGAILAWHYGCVPKVYVCTLSMARAVIGPHMKASLDALAKHFALAPKSVPYKDFDGLHWGELSPEIQTAVAEGSCHDLNLTRRISDFLLHGPYAFPAGELLVIDTTVRMFTRPALVGDVAALAEIWQHEEDTKTARFVALDVDPKTLNSQEGFADLLRAEGVEPATKTGKNGHTIYATAKTDPFMRDLLESDNERVALLAAARLGIRSTIDQTRSERLGFMARRGRLPVYLSYAAALTRRWGGADRLNWQNLPRPDPRNPRKGLLRKAIKAPKGHKIVKVDASQIECRILNTFAGQHDVVQAFAEQRDLYCELASKFYDRPVTKADTLERTLGKVLTLASGYGAGAATIRRAAKLGIYGPALDLTEQEAEEACRFYRAQHPAVVKLWWDAKDMLTHLYNGTEWDWGCLRVEDRRVFAPNGLFLDYTTLDLCDISKLDGDNKTIGTEWRVQTRTGWRRIYGAKLVENITQFMARVLLGEAIVRMRLRGLRILLTVHDDVYLLATAQTAQETLDIATEEMTRVPVWMPDLPLACEGTICDTLGG